MKKHLFLFITVFLSIALSCGKNRKPVLSDKELFAQKETTDTVRQMTSVSDTGTYVVPVVPPGIKYQESRSIDPEYPPVNFNIANRKLNIKKFNLADYYTKVRFVKLKHPMQASEGNFLFDTNCQIDFEKGGGIRGPWLNSFFKLTDDYIIAGDIAFGIHCYNKEGKFLYTIESNDFPKAYNASQNSISFNETDLKGFNGINSGISAVGNNCLYRLREDNKNMLCLYDLNEKKRLMIRPVETSDLFFSSVPLLLENNSMANYVYNLVDTIPGNFLFTFDLKGDTLCQFRNYNPIPKMSKQGNYSSPPSPNIYYYRNQLTVRQSMNDTVYRVLPPNRLLPAYVLNFGSYRIDMQTFLYGKQDKYLLPYTWKEANKYILFIYTQNRDTPNNRKDGSVKFFYSYYDKKSLQLYHFSEGTTKPENEFLMENSIPDALPFILSDAKISDNQLMVVYSKTRLEKVIKNKGFASLSPEQQKKLKTVQSELGESAVLIMILE